MSARPTIARREPDGHARSAVEALVATLQTGWDTGDAEIADQKFSADIAWGSPYGATVHGFETLFAIHHHLKAEGRGGSRSRYEIDRVLPISDDVIVAHVARIALDSRGEPAAARPEHPNATGWRGVGRRWGRLFTRS